jgi:hypothetical protein
MEAGSWAWDWISEGGCAWIWGFGCVVLFWFRERGRISRFVCVVWKVPASEAAERLESDLFCQWVERWVRCVLEVDGVTILATEKGAK